MARPSHTLENEEVYDEPVGAENVVLPRVRHRLDVEVDAPHACHLDEHDHEHDDVGDCRLYEPTHKVVPLRPVVRILPWHDDDDGD